MTNLLLILAFCTSFLFANIEVFKPGTPGVQPAGWIDGSGGTIATLAELRWLSETDNAWDESWTLANHIDAADTKNWNALLYYDQRVYDANIGDSIYVGLLDSISYGFTPIADNLSTSNDTNSFSGEFNGAGYTISNLYINQPTQYLVGLFSKTDSALIHNVTLDSSLITGSGYTGAIIGYAVHTIVTNVSAMNSTIQGSAGKNNWNIGGVIGAGSGRYTHIFSNSIVVGEDNTGGLIGGLEGDLDSSTVSGTVTAQGMYVGGVVGYFSKGSITHCTTSVAVHGENDVGGIIGTAPGGGGQLILNSVATGSVIGTSKVGGIIGSYSGAFTADSTIASVSVEGGTHVGGFAGYGSATSRFNNSYAEGSVTGDDNVGGFIGTLSNGQLQGVFSRSQVNGTTNVGGLVGNMGYMLFTDTTHHCFATGSVTGITNVGGLIGKGQVYFMNQSYATGDVSGTTNVGGFIGSGDGTNWDHLYATGTVTGDSAVGGFGGRLSIQEMKKNYAEGDVSGRAGVGGFVGLNEEEVQEAYATGSVTGVYNVGGLVGENSSNYGRILISWYRGIVTADSNVGGVIGLNEFSTGTLFSNAQVTGRVNVGGSIGFNTYAASKLIAAGTVSGTISVGGSIGHTTSGNITDVHFDSILSGATTSIGTESINSSLSPYAVTAYATEYMLDPARYIGFDFSNIWRFGTLNDSAVFGSSIPGPYLSWHLSSGFVEVIPLSSSSEEALSSNANLSSSSALSSSIVLSSSSVMVSSSLIVQLSSSSVIAVIDTTVSPLIASPSSLSNASLLIHAHQGAFAPFAMPHNASGFSLYSITGSKVYSASAGGDVGQVPDQFTGGVLLVVFE